MYQAGTLSGNPLAMAAGYEMLKMLSLNKSIYKIVEKQAAILEKGIRQNLRRLGLSLTLKRVGSMFTLFFTDKDVTDYNSAKISDTKKFATYFNAMLEQGIYLPPSQFEAAFLSASHTPREIEKTIEANFRALQATMQ
ncbi:MAG: aspartate aminotransferase family protein, partial [Ignavibacteriales bacterium]|nr:aspartate aminotransferase family protein [Ignavibacteriales bacterium]